MYRGAGRLLDRTLHPFRRRAARRRLARLGLQREVLVVCFGNICRSPYAAAVLSRLLLAEGRRVEVTQGGFFGPDRRSPETAREAALDRGIDLGPHRSRLLTADGARAATLVVVMETAQAERVSQELGVAWSRTLVLGDLDPEMIPSRDIADPYGMRRDVFAATYARIDRCVTALVAALPRG
jgi:protein-tyrosine-phosphatase